jgi:hypothetical protein
MALILLSAIGALFGRELGNVHHVASLALADRVE